MRPVLTFVYAAVSVLFIYLAGSFMAADFNIGNWADGLRWMIGFSGLIVPFFVVAVNVA